MIEQLRITAPVDRRRKLLNGFFLAEVLVENIVEEFIGQPVIGFRLEGASDLPDEHDMFDRGRSEQLLAVKNVGLEELTARRRDFSIALAELHESE